MQKKIYLTLLFLLMFIGAKAQTDGIFKIKVISVRENYHKNSFDSLKRMGILMFEPSDENFTRVYLGTYLGKSTAETILQDVQNSGFKTAYIVEEDKTFESTDGDTLTHTLQFSAVKDLDLRKITSHPKMDNTLLNKIYIWLFKGKYRLSLGLFTPEEQDLITQFKKALEKMDIKDSYLQKCYTPQVKTKKGNSAPKKNSK